MVKTTVFDIPARRFEAAFEYLKNVARDYDQREAVEELYDELYSKASDNEDIELRKVLVQLMEAGFSEETLVKFIEKLAGHDEKMKQLGIFTLQNAKREYAQKLLSEGEEEEEEEEI